MEPLISTDPVALGKLVQLTKEKGIQAIMENTPVDTVNNQVSVKYLYKENLKDLGENYYRVIKRTKTLVECHHCCKITALVIFKTVSF